MNSLYYNKNSDVHEVGNVEVYVDSSVLMGGNLVVCKSAVYDTGEIEVVPALEALIGALKDEETAVRRAAAKALGEISGQIFGNNQEKWQIWGGRRIKADS